MVLEVRDVHVAPELAEAQLARRLIGQVDVIGALEHDHLGPDLLIGPEGLVHHHVGRQQRHHVVFVDHAHQRQEAELRDAGRGGEARLAIGVDLGDLVAVLEHVDAEYGRHGTAQRMPDDVGLVALLEVGLGILPDRAGVLVEAGVNGNLRGAVIAHLGVEVFLQGGVVHGAAHHEVLNLRLVVTFDEVLDVAAARRGHANGLGIGGADLGGAGIGGLGPLGIDAERCEINLVLGNFRAERLKFALGKARAARQKADADESGSDLPRPETRRLAARFA